MDEEDTDDDYVMQVNKCRHRGGGLEIEIEAPERKSDQAKGISAATRSVLQIGNGDPEQNLCNVTLIDYGTTTYTVRSTCLENDSEVPGTCTFEGKENSNGYAFEGTLRCEGMHSGTNGPPDYLLSKAREFDEPVVLQIAKCE